MNLSEQQGEAIRVIANRSAWRNQYAWLAGFAGSGKTSIAPFLVEEMKARAPLYVAPTNKAARVLGSKVGENAISIHKAIYYPPDENPDSGALGWIINRDGAAAHADVIICDEASMVGTRLGQDLMSFGVPVVAIGDPGQLPPVQDDPFFCVGQPDFMLTEIHRQARDNPIIALSQRIREGERLKVGRMGEAVQIAERGDVDMPETMPQIIVGTHKKRWSVTAKVRKFLGHEGWLPRPGEPLISRKNNPETGLINGDELRCTGEARERDREHHTVDIHTDRGHLGVYDGLLMEHREREKRPWRLEELSPEWIAQRAHDHLDFGHAITCHVAQGSQWPHVLVYDESRVFRDEWQRWLYTACTRAAERLTVIVP